MGRGPPGPDGRPLGAPIGRRAPGGGGIGRPVALIGRPGGGGIGRPVELSGGRVDGEPPSPASPETERCVGRMVVGPLGDAMRVGAGFTIGARLRTTLGSATTGAAGVSGAGASRVAVLVSTGCVTRLTRAGAAATTSGSATSTAAFFVPVVLVAFVALAAFAASSGWTSRRRPSASARRRIRSAWASSMDAEGLEAPMPSFWASVSSSLLVRPSSLESSCTRIFFWAKTFPCFSYPLPRAQLSSLPQSTLKPSATRLYGTQGFEVTLARARLQGPGEVSHAQSFRTLLVAPPETAPRSPAEIPRTVSAPGPGHLGAVTGPSTDRARAYRCYASSSTTASASASPAPSVPSASGSISSTTMTSST